MYGSSRIIGNSSCRRNLELKKPAGDGHADKTNDLEDIKTFFKFVIIKVIILSEEVMHVEQIRVSHVFNQRSCHAFRRIFDIFLPEFLYEF